MRKGKDWHSSISKLIAQWRLQDYSAGRRSDGTYLSTIDGNFKDEWPVSQKYSLILSSEDLTAFLTPMHPPTPTDSSLKQELQWWHQPNFERLNQRQVWAVHRSLLEVTLGHHNLPWWSARQRDGGGGRQLVRQYCESQNAECRSSWKIKRHRFEPRKFTLLPQQKICGRHRCVTLRFMHEFDVWSLFLGCCRSRSR